MIIVGSYAAHLQCCTPTWRKTLPKPYKDVDFIYPTQERDHWQTVFTSTLTVNSEHWCHYSSDALLAFEFKGVPPDVYALLAKCSDPPRHIGLVGIAAQVASIEIIWAGYYLTAGTSRQKYEQMFRDLLHYEELVQVRGLQNDDHLQAALYFRDRDIAEIRTMLGNL